MEILVEMCGALLLLWKVITTITRVSFEAKTASIRKRVRLIVTYLWQSCNADFITEEMATSETNPESAPENSKTATEFAIPKVRKPPDNRTLAAWLIIAFAAFLGTRACSTTPASREQIHRRILKSNQIPQDASRELSLLFPVISEIKQVEHTTL